MARVRREHGIVVDGREVEVITKGLGSHYRAMDKMGAYFWTWSRMVHDLTSILISR